MRKAFVVLLIPEIIAGVAVAWIDSRPNWDDTGISVLMVLVAAAIFGFFTSEKPWLTALAVSIWIPLFGILSAQNFGSLLALVPGFAGAYLGYLFKRKGRG
jgi:hypothetical protein